MAKYGRTTAVVLVLALCAAAIEALNRLGEGMGLVHRSALWASVVVAGGFALSRWLK